MAAPASKRVTTSSSVSGCARWKSRSRPAGPSRRPITSTRSARRPGRTEAAARAAACSSSRACGRNACPSAVSRAPRAVRVNSRTPRSFSSAAMRLETACWVIDRSAAASWNWPASATATKVRTASRSTPTDLSRTTRGCGAPAGRLFDPRSAACLDLAGPLVVRDDGEGCVTWWQAVAGPAVRVAVGGVRGQHVRHLARVRRVPADRDPGAARRAGRGVGAGRRRAGGGRRGRGAARPVGGVPPQAAGDGRRWT